MLTSDYLIEGDIYTRANLSQMFNIKSAGIRNGVFQPAGFDSIWLFVTEKKPESMPQFSDFLDGDILYWDGQQKGRTDKLIIEHETNCLELLVFYRESKEKYNDYGFKYEGKFRYISHTGSQPTHFTLQKIDGMLTTVQEDMKALQIEESYQEGKQVSTLVNKHERNSNLRAAAIKIHGTRCQVCGFSFEETYGVHGKDFIEVHHLYPVSKYTGETSVSPKEDMRAVCSNCHRMIHRNADKPLSIEELRQIIQSHRAMR